MFVVDEGDASASRCAHTIHTFVDIVRLVLCLALETRLPITLRKTATESLPCLNKCALLSPKLLTQRGIDWTPYYDVARAGRESMHGGNKHGNGRALQPDRYPTGQKKVRYTYMPVYVHINNGSDVFVGHEDGAP